MSVLEVCVCVVCVSHLKSRIGYPSFDAFIQSRDPPRRRLSSEICKCSWRWTNPRSEIVLFVQLKLYFTRVNLMRKCHKPRRPPCPLARFMFVWTNNCSIDNFECSVKIAELVESLVYLVPFTISRCDRCYKYDLSLLRSTIKVATWFWMVSLWGDFLLGFLKRFPRSNPLSASCANNGNFSCFQHNNFDINCPGLPSSLNPIASKNFPHCASFVFQFLAYLWRSAVGLRPRLTVPCSVYCPCLVLCLVESQNIYWVQLVFGISDFAFRNWGLRIRQSPTQPKSEREMRRVPRKLCASHWQMVRAEDFVASRWSR